MPSALLLSAKMMFAWRTFLSASIDQRGLPLLCNPPDLRLVPLHNYRPVFGTSFIDIRPFPSS